MRRLFKLVRDIFSYQGVLRNMIIKDLKSKYRGSILGISWAIINPLLLMVAISFVFTVIVRFNIDNYPLFLLSGILPWMFFSTALSEATHSILSQQMLLHQFNLSKLVIPFSSVIANFINFLIGFFIIYPFFLIFKPRVVSFLPALILILLLHLFFTLGLGLILSISNVFFRDTGHLLGILLLFWFWITPIFYPLDMVPLKFRWICNLNPMTSYITYYRNILFEAVLPDLSTFLIVFLWTVVSLISGSGIFLKLESDILKRI